MAGSTKPGGGLTTRIAANTSVMLCATVNAETMPSCARRATRQEQAAEENEVVVAGEDVLDAKQQHRSRRPRRSDTVPP